ncbi:MAG: hypothetical protein ACK4V1_06670 [Burkholderiaceae bacterium]
MAGAVLSRRTVVAGAAVAAGAFGVGLLGAGRWLRRGESAAALAGVRWLEHPAGTGARLPRLAVHPDGGFVLCWVERVGAGHALRCARHVEGAWLPAVEVARGENWFVNWLDFPSVVPIDRDFWLAHRLVLRAGGGRYDYDIALALSDDGGRTWRDAGRPYTSTTAAEYGFASIFADGDAAAIVWLDGREYVKAAERPLHPDKSGNFALRATRVARDGHVEADRVLDANVCTCCQTAAAVTDRGALVAYRGRTEDELRDNKLVRRVAGAWSGPVDLGAEGWTIAACPTNGPALAARDSRVVAAWFTAAGDRPRVRAALSVDGGATWREPIELDTAAPLGRVGAAWVDAQRAAVSWIGAPAMGDGRAPLMLALLDARGREHARGWITRVAANRDSGLPQLVADRDRLVAAWTEPAPQYGIRLAEVDARAF